MYEQESHAAGGYEFTVPQNAIIQKTATYARLWGIISIVLGAMISLAGLANWPHGILRNVGHAATAG